MSSSRVGRTIWAIAILFASTAVLTLPTAASAATPAPTTTDIPVSSHRVWTATGVVVRPGDTVAIRSTGTIHFGGPPINRMPPAGIPWKNDCSGLSKQPQPWPAPGLACWSMIARVGSGPPLEIGAARTFRVTQEGELFVGINDNFLVDNLGAWAASAQVTPPGGATVPTTAATVPPTVATVPTTAATGSKDDSNTLAMTALAIAGLLAAIGLVALMLLVVRRRSTARRAAAERSRDARPIVPAAFAPNISGDLLPDPRPAVAPVAAPVTAPVEPIVLGDPTDVNIFEVEFPDYASLRVGYSYFPQGTLVRWLVRQSAAIAATGEFVTSGGGGANHFVTIALGVELDRSSDVVDIDFTWDIGGVPFGYAVRRQPQH